MLIGNKMDKAKKAAEAAKAQAQILTDAQGTQYVKATFSSGLLFQTGKYVLSPTAAQDINNFISNRNDIFIMFNNQNRIAPIS